MTTGGQTQRVRFLAQWIEELCGNVTFEVGDALELAEIGTLYVRSVRQGSLGVPTVALAQERTLRFEARLAALGKQMEEQTAAGGDEGPVLGPYPPRGHVWGGRWRCTVSLWGWLPELYRPSRNEFLSETREGALGEALDAAEAAVGGAAAWDPDVEVSASLELALDERNPRTLLRACLPEPDARTDLEGLAALLGALTQAARRLYGRTA